MTSEQEIFTEKRLYKSRRDRMIDGVCGGIGEYFGVDATIVRGVFIILALFGGAGLVIYIAGMIIIPVNPNHFSMMQSGEMQPADRNVKRMWGIVLVGIGLVILMHNLGIFAFYSIWHISWGMILPIMIILLGMMLIYAHQQSRRTPAAAGGEGDQTDSGTQYKRLFKSRRDRKLFGVCGGLGDYFDVDPTIIRILFVLLAWLSFGTGIVLYIAMAIFVPEEKW